MGLFDLSGRTALVTGSSRGIGMALAEGLLAAGARVVVHGRDRERAPRPPPQALARRTGGETAVATFDVTDADAVDRGVARGRADGGACPTSSSTTPASSAAAPLARLQHGRLGRPRRDQPHAACSSSGGGSRAAWPSAGSGKIVNIGSVQSRLARPGHRPLRRHQGRPRDAHPGDVRRPRPARGPGQRPRPGLRRDRAHRRARRRRRVHRLGASAARRRGAGDGSRTSSARWCSCRRRRRTSSTARCSTSTAA